MEARVRSQSPARRIVEAAPSLLVLGWILPLLIIVLASCFFVLKAQHGIRLGDEGYILSLADRVRAGQVPYEDFYTLYPPTIYYLLAWSFEFLGDSLLISRYLVAVVKAVNLILVFLIGRKLLPAFLTGVPLLLLLLFDLADRSQLIAYAAIFAESAVLMVWLFLVYWIEKRRPAFVILAGIGCALAFAFKQPPGALCVLACLAWFASLSRQGLYLGRGYYLSQLHSWLLILISLLVPLAFGTGAAGLLFVVPAVVAVAVLFMIRERETDLPAPQLLWFFVAGNLAALGIWMGWLVSEMGWATFVGGVIHEPMRQASIRFAGSHTVSLMMGAEALLLTYGFAFLLGTLILVITPKSLQEKDLVSYRGAQLGVTLCGFLVLTLYPWPTSTRAIWVAAPFVLFLTWAVRWYLRPEILLSTLRRSLLAGGVLLVLLYGLLLREGLVEDLERWGGRIVSTIASTWTVHFELPSSERMVSTLGRAPIFFRNDDKESRAILQTAEWIRRNTPESEPIFVYPSGGFFHFLSLRPNPLPYASLGVRQTLGPRNQHPQSLETLRVAQVEYMVWVGKRGMDSGQSARANQAFKRYLLKNYQIVTSFGRFSILARLP